MPKYTNFANLLGNDASISISFNFQRSTITNVTITKSNCGKTRESTNIIIYTKNWVGAIGPPPPPAVECLIGHWNISVFGWKSIYKDWKKSLGWLLLFNISSPSIQVLLIIMYTQGGVNLPGTRNCHLCTYCFCCCCCF